MLAVAGLLASGFVVQPGALGGVGTAARVQMAIERVPGEGDPFSGIGKLDSNPAPCSVSTVEGRMMDVGYIEEDDEPWHASCKPRTAVSKGALDSALSGALPFMAAESALEGALAKVETVKDVDAAIAQCLKDGGRAGCPAIMAAEKVKKAEEGGKVKALAQKKVAQGAGWDNFSRSLAKTHDNSI